MGTTSTTSPEQTSDKQFKKAITLMKQQRNMQNIEYTNINAQYQQKYRGHLIQVLNQSQLPYNFKILILETIENRIKKKDLTQTVAVINGLKNDRVEEYLNLREFKEMRNRYQNGGKDGAKDGKNQSKNDRHGNDGKSNITNNDNSSIISVTVKFDKNQFKNKNRSRISKLSGFNEQDDGTTSKVYDNGIASTTNYQDKDKIPKNAKTLYYNYNTAPSKISRNSSRSKSKMPKYQTTYKSRNTTQTLYLKNQQNHLQIKLKFVKKFLIKQINKPHHPFVILTKRFTQMFSLNLQKQKRQNIKMSCKSQEKYQQKQKYYKKILSAYMKFILNGCLSIYKKWILKYTSMEEKKYQKMMNSIILNQMFIVNQGFLSVICLKIIRKIKMPRKIDYDKLMGCSLRGFLMPKNFYIDAELQIQGHYFLGIYEMAMLGEKIKPMQIFKQLQTIKASICKDVDNYYTSKATPLTPTSSTSTPQTKTYQINGDNIMGIIAYILSKISTKIEQIYTVLLFLKFIYGQVIFYGLNQHSYMYSTLWGAIEYIENMRVQEEELRREKQKQMEKQKQKQRQRQRQRCNKEKLKQNPTAIQVQISQQQQYQHQHQHNKYQKYGMIIQPSPNHQQYLLQPNTNINSSNININTDSNILINNTNPNTNTNTHILNINASLQQSIQFKSHHQQQQYQHSKHSPVILNHNQQQNNIGGGSNILSSSNTSSNDIYLYGLEEYQQHEQQQEQQEQQQQEIYNNIDIDMDILHQQQQQQHQQHQQHDNVLYSKRKADILRSGSGSQGTGTAGTGVLVNKESFQTNGSSSKNEHSMDLKNYLSMGKMDNGVGNVVGCSTNTNAHNVNGNGNISM